MTARTKLDLLRIASDTQTEAPEDPTDERESAERMFPEAFAAQGVPMNVTSQVATLRVKSDD